MKVDVVMIEYFMSDSLPLVGAILTLLFSDLRGQQRSSAGIKQTNEDNYRMPLCRGTKRVIADITDPDLIQKTLDHLAVQLPPFNYRHQLQPQLPHRSEFG